MNRMGLGLAVGAGYLLGRTKKLKMAVAVGSLVAGKKLNLGPKGIADLVNQQLKNNPQFKEIGDTLRQDLRGVGKAASGAMVERQMSALADRLHGRTERVRDQLSGGGPGGEEAEGEYEEEGEDEYEDREGREAEEEPGPSDESEEPEKPKQEGAEGAGGDRKRPAKKTPAKKAPAKKTAERAQGGGPAKKAAKKAPAKKAAAKKTAAGRTAAKKTAGSATRAAGSRNSKGGGDR